MSDRYLDAAIEEARIGLREGGIPIGAVLVDAAGGAARAADAIHAFISTPTELPR